MSAISKLQKRLPEMANLERVIKSLNRHARVEVEGVAHWDGIEFPLYSIVMGTSDKSAPTLGVYGGVHGLERIGSEVVIAYLQTLSESLEWDRTLQDRLSQSRLVFMPIVNPVGMYLTQRSNGQGVDLMRNSPVRANPEPNFLVGGQKFSRRLPWYQGEVEKFSDMEIEAQAACNLGIREILPAKLSISVDVHSGFGSVDRLWFPFAKSLEPPPHLAEITSLKRLFDRTYPNHFYRIEPQAKQYTTHGDLWDYLYELHLGEDFKNTGELAHAPNQKMYMPWTLELGSWMWIKKNPRQMFSALGPFNPLQPHRLQRILRRHLTLFDFLHRALLSSDPWINLSAVDRDHLLTAAHLRWYSKDSDADEELENARFASKIVKGE